MASVRKTLPILLRNANKRDVPFITNSWLKSFREYGYFNISIGNRTYFMKHHMLLEELIPRSIMIMAVNEENPDQILGWVCAEVVNTALVIHYLYIKGPFRGFGIARALYEKLVAVEEPPMIISTHLTRQGRSIAKEKKIKGFVYDPYLMFQTLPSDWSKRDENPADDGAPRGPEPDPGPTSEDKDPQLLQNSPGGARDMAGGGADGDDCVSEDRGISDYAVSEPGLVDSGDGEG